MTQGGDMSIEMLLAEREIHRALVRFARAMDERDWAALDPLLLEEATADLGTGPLRGRAEIVSQMRSFLDDCGPTQHLLGNLLVDVDGDSATSRVYVSDMHVGQGDEAQRTFSTLGDYHDRWRRQGGVWRIAHRTKLNRAMLGDIRVLGPGPPGWSRDL
jgi:3-phenylpropionate/cinnamic acid dioxygenase small subunit